MDHWNRGVRCPCETGIKRITIEYARSYFAKFGYVLLSKEYKYGIKLKYKCSEGHVHTMKWGNFKSGYRCPTCAINNRRGENNCNYKGGVTKKDIPLYETFKDKLPVVDTPVKIGRGKLAILGACCHYCGTIFEPTRLQVSNRLRSLNGNLAGECNLYCSDKCKHSCSTFKQVKFFKDTNKASKVYRVHQKQWAKLVKEQDNHTCLICGNTDCALIAHHEIPVKVNELLSLDLYNGLTLCKTCHKEVHKLNWCTTGFLSNCKNSTVIN